MSSSAISCTNLHPPQHGASHTAQYITLDLATYLEQVVVQLVCAVNLRSRVELELVVQAYHAPSLMLDRSLLPGLGTVAASDHQSYIDGILAYTEAFNFRMQPHNVTALLDELNGTAKVFATVTATGTEEAGDTVTNESVLIYHFENWGPDCNDRSQWKVVRLQFIRGPGNHFV